MADKERVQQRIAHNVIMENRHTLSLSGVRDVDSFDEQTVVLITEMGELTIRGIGLHIIRLDQESGELYMDGEISELVYTDEKPEQKGLFSRLFR